MVNSGSGNQFSLPAPIGANFSLQYQVSPGITTFQLKVYATAIAGWSLFEYPRVS